MSLESDCLLAVTGVRPDAITPAELDAAKTVLARFGRRVRAWVRSGKREPFEPAKVPNLDKWLADISEDLSEEKVTALLAATDPESELSSSYYAGLQHAREWLLERWPRTMRPTNRGPRSVELAADDAAAWWDIVRVVEDPDAIIELLEQGTLSAEQAEAFRDVYPELHDFVEGVIDDALNTAPEKWEPTPDVDDLLATLAGVPVATEAAPALPPPAPPPGKGIDLAGKAAKERTKADIAAAPVSPTDT